MSIYLGKIYSLFLTLALLFPTACGPSLPVDGRATFQASVPDQWGVANRVDSPEVGSVFDSFSDPTLARLISEGLNNNFSLRSAAARISAARARAKLAGADLLPVAALDLSAARRRTQSNGTGSINNSFGLNGSVRWELDLWNRLSATEQAAISDAAASVADREAVELSLAASIARSWYRLTEAERQQQLANEVEASYRQSLQVIEEQYRSGLTSALDLRLARSALTNAQATQAERGRLRDLEQRLLEQLLGRYPAGVIAGAEQLPALTTRILAGLPSSLLQRRPDMRAAALRLEAEEQRSAAAQLNRLPIIQLTTSAGTASNQLYRLLDWDYLVWSLAGSVAQTLFDGGRNTAEQQLAKAQVDQQLADYADVALGAFREVETALAAESSLQLQEQALQLSVDEALEARSLAEQRYRQGLEGIITLLETQRRFFTAQITLLRTRRLRLDNRIDLHLALGGSFTAPQPLTEIMESP